MEERYIAAMVLSGVGDAMGFKGGSWEFTFVGEDIHKDLKKLGGIKKLHIKCDKKKWPVSDDTVLHIATAKALCTNKPIGDTLYMEFAHTYKKGSQDMSGRSPGGTTMENIHMFKMSDPKGYIVPFNRRGGGCGAAMRAMCIGLRYHKPEQLKDLIAIAVESGRMTHNCPTGYLGSLASALFTSYAVQNKPIREWGVGLMDTLPKALDYVTEIGRDVEKNKETWSYFTEKWTAYLQNRGLTDGQSDPTFPEPYGIKERDDFYKSVSFSGWGGASGHDAPMIAYDAFLGASDSWEELCHRGMIHGGDNDSTGVMAGCWYGVMHGFEGVPKINYKDLEYRDVLEDLGKELYKLTQKEST
ncbi:ADP-ribosylhydrolase ARH1-like [Amphiura filiformis]|uniref:ADP-ribosylhydrolase ARH1-like n=1 Tax=Amphiura filiformis TaxID=82378 RepID=UPI003B21AFF0